MKKIYYIKYVLYFFKEKERMYKLYYAILNKDTPEPGLYFNHSLNINNDDHWTYQKYVRFIRHDLDLSIGDKIFIVFDKKKREIIRICDNEDDIEDNEKNLYIYSTNIFDNLFEGVFTR